MCAAEMQIRALESSTGVAGNATETTATCSAQTEEFVKVEEEFLTSWLAQYVNKAS